MDEQKQIEKLFDLFNKEQGTFAYYTCGLSVVMIGYSFKVVMDSTAPYVVLPLIAIFIMFASLGLGIYFLKYRVANYHNTVGLLNLKKKTKNDNDKMLLEDAFKRNSKGQSFYLKAHFLTIGIGPLIMFVWLIILKW